MPAKMITAEQAKLFHKSQTGFEHCFDDCCLHREIRANAELETRIKELEKLVANLETLLPSAALVSPRDLSKREYEFPESDAVSWDEDGWPVIS